MLTPRVLTALPYLAVAATLILAKCQHDATKAQWGVDQIRLHLSDSTVNVLRRDSVRTAGRLAVLAVDSALLADQATKLRTDFQREQRRWETMVADWRQIAANRDTVFVEPTLPPTTVPELIEQANATIGACRMALGNCEARATNAESRAAVNDSLWRTAESKAAQYLLQSNIWRHRAQPSLWQQLKQLPGRAVTTTAIASVGYAACKLGGL